MADTIATAMGVEPQEAVDQAINSLGGFATGRFTRPDEVADHVLMLAGDRTPTCTARWPIYLGCVILSTKTSVGIRSRRRVRIRTGLRLDTLHGAAARAVFGTAVLE